MQPKQAARWGTVLKWALSAVALGFLVRALLHADLPRAAERIAAIGPAIVLILVPYLLALLLDSAACVAIFRTLGRAASARSILLVRISSEAVNTSLPGGGVWAESINPYLLNRRCGIPASEAIAGMAAKKWLQMRAHGFYILTSALVGYGFLSAHSRAIVGFEGLPFVVAASAFVPMGLSIAMAASLSRGAIVEKLHGLLRKVPSTRLRAWLDGRRHHFVATDALFGKIASARKTEIAGTFLFLASWLMESVETLVILRLLGVPIGFAEVLSFEAGLSLLRNLAFFAPGGLGVQDLGYIAYLSALGYPGAASLGAAFVLLKRAKELFWIAVGYSLFLTLRGRPEIISGEPEAQAPASVQSAP